MNTAIIEIGSEADLKDKFAEVAHVLHNLRFFTKFWNEHGGYQARRRMQYWQERADALLDSMGLTLHNNIQAVQIIKQ